MVPWVRDRFDVVPCLLQDFMYKGMNRKAFMRTEQCNNIKVTVRQEQGHDDSRRIR